ncbi:MAG: hypothetical protein HQM08_24800 [Candidatus Riflebacteria bacterium]|nr:hypothetical protein [Candidatus Riflebacteria bacterium]
MNNITKVLSTKAFAKSGFVSYLFLFIVMFISILAIQFYKVAEQQRQSNFQFRQVEIARNIVEGALEEAYSWFFKETANPKSPSGQWLIARNSAPFSIPLNVSIDEAKTMVRANVLPEITASARVIDFRTTDEFGNQYAAPSGKDCLGTIEFRAKLIFKSSDSRPSIAFTGVRHIEYNVVSIVSPRENAGQRSAYSHCFPLDYVLFVRNGLDEFRKYNSFSLNSEKKRLIVEQKQLLAEKRGKIYFGETDSQKSPTGLENSPPLENNVFLDVPEALEKIIPPCSQTLEIGHDDVLTLLPWLNDKLLEALKQQESAVQSAHFENLKGVFEIKTLPLPKKEYSSERDLAEKDMMFLLSQQFLGGEGVFLPESGHFLLGEDPDFVKNSGNALSILEGAIRKRFFYLVAFHLDMSQARVVGKAKKGPISKSFNEAIPPDAQAEFLQAGKSVPCIPLPKDRGKIDNEYLKGFLTNLPTVAQKYPQVSLISRFDTNFLYGGSGEDVQNPPQKAQFPTPRFFNSKGQNIDVHRTGNEGFRPFNFFSLWNRKLLPVGRLEEIGYLCPTEGLIKPRGIIHCQGSLEFVPVNGGDWKIKGQGVIIADSFVISAGIQKSGPEDLLILFTRKGGIRVTTDRPIEAVLIATNDNENGSIVCQQPLKLKGALICDLLETYRWVDGKHLIEYDSLLKNSDEYQYQICLSNWTNFVRMAEE